MIVKKPKYESKQVGVIYHVCSLDSVYKYIMPNDILKSSGRYGNSVFKSNDFVSFTRDKKYIPAMVGADSPVVFQFIVDGNKISEKHKVSPFNYKTKIVGFSEAEESVLGQIENFRSFLIGVNFYISEVIMEYIENQQKLDNLLYKAWKIDDYLNGIPTQKKELGNVYSSWFDNYTFNDEDLDILFEQLRISETFSDLCNNLQAFQG